MTSEPTPMMRQYRRLKDSCTDAILFFRLGDFYEMFQRDAREASSILNLTLTKRHGIPMCGIPYHAASSYISRLLRAGRKVAICEQVSLPEKGKGITEREIVEIITPGTVVDEDFLDQGVNNYILSIGKSAEHLSLAYIDPSTGEFFAASFLWSERIEKLKEFFYRLNPREILVQETLLTEDRSISNIINQKTDLLVNHFPDWSYDQAGSVAKLCKQFNVLNLKGFGLDENDPALFSTGVLLQYLKETAKSVLPHIQGIRKYEKSEYLGLDESTQKNLEIVKNLNDGSKKYTLIEILDYTKTAPGARKIRKWLLNPLKDRKHILSRQGKVEELYRNQLLLRSVRDGLSSILDIERLSARVALEKAHAKDLLGIKNTLNSALSLRDLLKETMLFEVFKSGEEKEGNSIKIVTMLLEASIAEEPPIVIHEGGLIKTGYSAELDELKRKKSDSQQILQEYLDREKELSGIPALKIRYNKIIGYYLEVTKTHLKSVPDHFIRRQSLVGSERFTTEELINLETELTSISERVIELEKVLFLEVRNQVKEAIPLLLNVASSLSEIDCIHSLAQAATIHGYIKPEITNSRKLSIKEGRHPVVEAHLSPGTFIPNNCILGTGQNDFILLTGPNMAGKSTYLRQIALIVLMAQTGSFVPAEEAQIGLVDKIFCRVGASDNLARGESTFLVEMNETANILRGATKMSLVIMDEVGRGTSTHDGLSIAWAVSEHLLRVIGAKTLFATHYHELTYMEEKGFSNFSMQVSEANGKIIFLKKVLQGAAGHSYGIHVASLAGLPEEVILRAEELLEQISGKEQKKPSQISEKKSSPSQNELFLPQEMVIRKILSLQINTLSPLQALNLLSQLQKELS